MPDETPDELRWLAAAPPRPVVGEPVLGCTTDGKWVTWYVTEVTPEGVIKIGPDKP